MTNLIEILSYLWNATHEELKACHEGDAAYDQLKNEEDLYVATRGAFENHVAVPTNAGKSSVPTDNSKVQEPLSRPQIERPWIARVEARNQQQSPAPFRDVDSPPPMLSGVVSEVPSRDDSTEAPHDHETDVKHPTGAPSSFVHHDKLCLRYKQKLLEGTRHLFVLPYFVLLHYTKGTFCQLLHAHPWLDLNVTNSSSHDQVR